MLLHLQTSVSDAWLFFHYHTTLTIAIKVSKCLICIKFVMFLNVGFLA